MKKVMWQFS